MEPSFFTRCLQFCHGLALPFAKSRSTCWYDSLRFLSLNQLILYIKRGILPFYGLMMPFLIILAIFGTFVFTRFSQFCHSIALPFCQKSVDILLWFSAFFVNNSITFVSEKIKKPSYSLMMTFLIILAIFATFVFTQFLQFCNGIALPFCQKSGKILLWFSAFSVTKSITFVPQKGYNAFL